MVHTPKGPVASGLGEAEVMLEEAVVEAGEVTPCRMPALTMLMIPSGDDNTLMAKSKEELKAS